MHQPGVEIRPLREMTGRDVQRGLPHRQSSLTARIGDVNNGWAVANTTLQFERSGMEVRVVAPVRGA
jgi:alkylation response protein AidB-like acyl-CoA dehydrogenase